MRKLFVLVFLGALFSLPALTWAATCDNTTPGASFVPDNLGGGYYVCPSGAVANAVTGAVATATPATPAATAPTQAVGGGSSFIPLAPIPGLTQGVTANSAGTTAFLNNLYKFLIGIAAVLAVLEIMWGGFQYATQDSVSKKGEGKKRIQQAFFGLALVLLPVLVFGIINPQILNLSIGMGPLNVQNTPGVVGPASPNTDAGPGTYHSYGSTQDAPQGSVCVKRSIEGGYEGAGVYDCWSSMAACQAGINSTEYAIAMGGPSALASGCTATATTNTVTQAPASTTPPLTNTFSDATLCNPSAEIVVSASGQSSTKCIVSNNPDVSTVIPAGNEQTIPTGSWCVDLTDTASGNKIGYDCWASSETCSTAVAQGSKTQQTFTKTKITASVCTAR